MNAATTAEKVEAVKNHAAKKYDDGWDVVIEAWSDDDIAKCFGQAVTTAGAIRKVRAVVEVMHDREEDIRATRDSFDGRDMFDDLYKTQLNPMLDGER